MRQLICGSTILLVVFLVGCTGPAQEPTHEYAAPPQKAAQPTGKPSQKLIGTYTLSGVLCDSEKDVGKLAGARISGYEQFSAYLMRLSQPQGENRRPRCEFGKFVVELMNYETAFSFGEGDHTVVLVVLSVINYNLSDEHPTSIAQYMLISRQFRKPQAI